VNLAVDFTPHATWDVVSYSSYGGVQVRSLHDDSRGQWGIVRQDSEPWSVDGESMGRVDVCGDEVPRHVVCFDLPCKDKNSIRIIFFSQLMRLLDPCCYIE
jgi:hypothetical protein